MNIQHRTFIEGMELAMRICHNRAKDLNEIGATHKTNWPLIRENEAETCAGLIRILQVEIGAGRMRVPALTQDEIDEIERIS